jgi:hypothetical protein
MAAYKQLGDSITVLREKCTGVSWELDNAQIYQCFCLWWLGRLHEMTSLVSTGLREATERDDLFLRGVLSACPAILWQLVLDQPDEARRLVDEVSNSRSGEHFYTDHWFRLVGRTLYQLYRGDGVSAWQAIAETWPHLKRSLLLRSQTFRAFALQLRAHAALAAASEVADARPYRERATADASRLARGRLPYCKPFANQILATVLTAKGDTHQALRLLDAAAEGFQLANMAVCAEAVRFRIGQLVGGQAGASQQAELCAGMEERGIRNPERLSAMLAPGFRL